MLDYGIGLLVRQVQARDYELGEKIALGLASMLRYLTKVQDGTHTDADTDAAVKQIDKLIESFT